MMTQPQQQMQAAAVEVSTLVAEITSTSVRMGWAGDDQPRLVYPSYVVRRTVTNNGASSISYRIGDVALMGAAKESSGNSALPVVVQTVAGGRVLDWDALGELWRWGLARLGLDKKSNGDGGEEISSSMPPVLVVLPVGFEDRDRLVRMLFEGFMHPAVYLARSPVMAAFGAGRHTGVVVDIGAEGVRVTPIHDGYVMTAGVVEQAGLGGKFLTESLLEVLRRSSVPESVLSTLPFERTPLSMTPSVRAYHQMVMMNEVKEAVVQVPESAFDTARLALRPPIHYEFTSSTSDPYTLQMGVERFRLGELLFNPALSGNNVSAVGLVEMIRRAVEGVDTEQRSAIASSLILTGGGSLLTGLGERLSAEINKQGGGVVGKLRVHTGTASPGSLLGSLERRFGAWMGGSVLGSLASFQGMWLTSAEWSAESSNSGPLLAKKFQ